MATRVQQDTFMDDSDDACPLCVEEFDLSDKSFRPCPCGYQVCQFCYNNIKNNMNGLCPACRRPYDDQSIEWKVVSSEEQKADVALQARKKALARQKETERRQVETLNRKHLAGLRVVQKNLVYVVGLNPKSREEDLLQTLRGDQYFGQYGKIIKIVVSKAKEGTNGSNSIGVYVTFARKQDAASCIAAVDGSQNGDRVLRAQYGTTKYCSAFLRNETCNNRNCMFLHETGEDFDSFSRQDLSSMNAVPTQRPALTASSPSSSSRLVQQPPQAQPPPQQAPQPIAAVSQPTVRRESRDEAMSRSDSGDGSALPSSASWVVKNAQNDSRRSSSKPASVSASSPAFANAPLSMQTEDGQTTISQRIPQESDHIGSAQTLPTLTDRLFSGGVHPLDRAMKTVLESSYKFTFDRSMYNDEALREIDAYPPLFDANGGLVRYRLEQEREQGRLKQEEEERNALSAVSTAQEDENPASGSLQLGGEPETQDEPSEGTLQSSTDHRNAIQPPYSGSGSLGTVDLGGSSFLANNSSNVSFNGRTLTPQQQQQLSFLRSNGNRQSPVNNQFQTSYSGNTSQHHHQQSNPFQSQTQNLGSIPGHARQASRYTFANDSASASAAVKPAANAQLMAQQSTMMPATQSKHYQNPTIPQSSIQNNHFYSGVQGPPPGLKSSGTPPISGGGMFGQGHGFASAMGGSLGISGANTGSKNSNEELMRELLRGRGGNVNSQGVDVGKREFTFPSSVYPPTTSNTAPASGLLSSLYGSQLGTYNGYQDHSVQKQKKKGKKHRHANTSSSGGGGIVDLADPSILQARMHHAGVGQGQFGVQGQGFQDSPYRTGEGITAIASLIEGSATDTPDPFSPSGPISKSKISTLMSVPPGLSMPQDFPPLATPQTKAVPLVKAQRRPTPHGATAAAIKPVIPVLPTSSARITGQAKESQPTQHDHATGKSKDTIGIQPGASESESKAKVTGHISIPLASSPLPAKPGSQIGSSSGPLAREIPQGMPNAEKKAASGKVQKPVEKRQHPGKLDIEAAKDASKKILESVASSSGQPKPANFDGTTRPPVTTASQASTPATAASQTSVTSVPRQNQPRTVRVLPTPNAETPRLVAASPSVATATAGLAASKQVSRRGSFASIQPPGTPTSERISDNASITSNSLSRASSPPPGRIGSAPVRQVTKSQQKKERQAKAKQAEELTKPEEIAAKVILEEPVQAPIIGRKKKTKKTTIRGTTNSTPSVSRPSSPPLKDESYSEREVSVPVTPVKDTKKDSSKFNADKKEAESPLSPAFATADPQQKPTLTAASIFADLQKSGDISSTVLELFKGVSGVNYRFELGHTDLAESTNIPVLSNAQVQQLDQGDAICIEHVHNKRVIVLPDRCTLRGLSHDQAQRYLALRKQALSTPEPLMFNSSRHDIDRYLHVAPPSALASSNPNDLTSVSPEDSLELVNRFVIPPSSNNTQAASPIPAYWSASLPADVKRLPTMTVEDAEQALLSSRKETEGLEKKLNGLLKRNRRLIFGNGH